MVLGPAYDDIGNYYMFSLYSPFFNDIFGKLILTQLEQAFEEEAHPP